MLLWQVSVPYAVTPSRPGTRATGLHVSDEEQPPIGEKKSRKVQTRSWELHLRAKLTMFWLTPLKTSVHPYRGIPREEKLCFLCPVGLKEENLFTKAWKYFITSSRGRSVLMTWSTGLWLAAGFLKLQRAHWSACQPLGQRWDETDKMIVSNEIQISRSVWTRTRWALFSFFFWRGVFHIDLEFEGRLWKSLPNSNQSSCTSPGGALIPFEVLQANTAPSACWTLLSWQP